MGTGLPHAFTVNGITADFRAGFLHDRTGRDITLRSQAFAVLKYLTQNPNRVVSKDEVMQAVWGGVAVTDDSLVQCITDIRKAIGDDDHTVIRTVPKRGYMLTIPDVGMSRSSNPNWKMAALVLCLVTIAAAGLWSFTKSDIHVSSEGVPLVAVLPFDSIGGDVAAQRLADGLTEDIITDLARFPEFAVVASNSTADYKGKAVDPRAVSIALHVGYVVEGSIQREANRVRIVAHLIDAPTGQDLWSDRWDRADRDLFAIQTEIAEQVANRLGGGAGLIQEAGRNAARRKRPENLNAYELYLLGTEKLELFTKADIDESIRLLTRAVELDPGLARAWAELFHSYSISVGFGADREMAMRKADEAARIAVRLDPGDPEAHAVLGMSFGLNGDFARGKTEFDTAMRLAPNAAEIVIFYSGWASTFGEPERGAELVDQAMRLDPNYPMWAVGSFSYAYFMAGRYEDALRMLDRETEANYNRDKWIMRSSSLAALGRVEEAKIWLAKALKADPDITIEAQVDEPGFNDTERQRFVETMRMAGFPPCASGKQLVKMKKPRWLPECLLR